MFRRCGCQYRPGAPRATSATRSWRSAVPRASPDPWQIERLVWSVLDVMVPAPGTRASPPDGAGAAAAPATYATARRIADLFDRYHLHRPDDDPPVERRPAVDGAGRPLSDTSVWQAHLWRLVRATDRASRARPSACPASSTGCATVRTSSTCHRG